MRFLLDENLSPSLVRHLAPLYDAVHVRDAGLRGHSDRDVWSWARVNVQAIISKDSDFADLVVLHGPPPKVVVLQLGNCRTSDVVALLIAHHDEIIEFMNSAGEALLALG